MELLEYDKHTLYNELYENSVFSIDYINLNTIIKDIIFKGSEHISKIETKKSFFDFLSKKNKKTTSDLINKQSELVNKEIYTYSFEEVISNLDKQLNSYTNINFKTPEITPIGKIKGFGYLKIYIKHISIKGGITGFVLNEGKFVTAQFETGDDAINIFYTDKLKDSFYTKESRTIFYENFISSFFHELRHREEFFYEFKNKSDFIKKTITLNILQFVPLYLYPIKYYLYNSMDIEVKANAASLILSCIIVHQLPKDKILDIIEHPDKNESFYKNKIVTLIKYKGLGEKFKEECIKQLERYEEIYDIAKTNKLIINTNDKTLNLEDYNKGNIKFKVIMFISALKQLYDKFSLF